MNTYRDLPIILNFRNQDQISFDVHLI
jgi:hypothetical protein